MATGEENKLKIDKAIEEYKKAKERYEDFARSISFILEKILKSKKIRYQQIQYRSKDIASLRSKLENNPNLLNTTVQDLAGCRVIFYLEEDIYRFVELLKQVLKIVEMKDKRSPDDYNALHVIVKLDSAREGMVEYSGFKDTICEIQLTTPLFHAWSEINHDIGYKTDTELKKFSQKDYDFLEKKLSEIMSNYLVKASYTFSFIVSQFARLKEGKQTLNIDTLGEVSKSDSNEQILSYLNKLASFSTYYRLPPEFDFLPVLEGIWAKAQQNDERSQQKKASDIIAASFRLIRPVKYWDYKKVIDICVKRCSEDLFQNECLGTLKEFSKYDLNAVKLIGYDPQKTLITSISNMKIEKAEIRDALISISNLLLNNSIEGYAQEQFNTLTLMMGPIPVNDTLKEIRKAAIALLLKLFERETNYKESENIIAALFNCASPIHHGKMTEEHSKTIHENLEIILAFINVNYSKLKNRSKKSIEGHLSRGFISKYESVLIQEVRAKMAKDADYLKYKALVGYDLDYGLDFKDIESKRRESLDGYIAQITDDNIDEWKNYLINELLDGFSDQNQGEYYNVHYLLRMLATHKPNEGKRLLDVPELSKFRISLLIGLLESDKKAEIKETIKNKIEKGENLAEIASAFFSIKDIDAIIVSELTDKILSGKDVPSLLAALQTICKHYQGNEHFKEVFVKVIGRLTDLSFHDWPEKMSYLAEPITNGLTAEEYRTILKNLVLKDTVDYPTEQILLPLAEKEPKQIIDFFRQRIENRGSDEGMIDAVPYRFLLLGDRLKIKSDIVIKEILKLVESEDWKLKWGASSLLTAIFPVIDENLSGELGELVKTKDSTKLDNVLWVLDRYDGSPGVLAIAKEIVESFQVTDQLKSRLQGSLSNTSVLMGEDGLIKAYEEKIASVNSWKSDTHKSVAEFAESYISYLENSIKYEKARVSRDIDLRKNEFERIKAISQ